MHHKKFWTIILSLILLALCSLMVLVGLFTFRRFNIGSFRFSDLRGNIPNIMATADESKSLVVTPPAALIIDNPFGSIKLTGSDSREIKVDMHKMAWGIDQQTADANLEKLTIEITQEGNTVTIKVLQPETAVVNLTSVDFTVAVPLETTVNATLQNGDLEVIHLAADAILNSDFGSVTMTDLQKGRLTMTSKNGSVSATQIHSDNRPVELSSDFGEVSLTDSNGSDITVNSRNGEVTLKNVKSTGNISLSSDFGSVNFEEGQSGPLDVTSKNGSLNLVDVKVNGLLKAQSDFGSLTLNKAAANSYDLQNKNGSIDVDGAGGEIIAHSDFGDINILNGQDGNLSLSTQNGSISYQGSLGSGPHSLTSNFGDIHLGIPADSSLVVDLQTEFGEINNAFEITTQGKMEEQHFTGKINSGGARLEVKTSNGGINLEKSIIKEQ